MSDLDTGLDLDLGGGPGEGGWLYKDKGAVCGPVPAAVLIDKLYRGEVDGETSISPEFGGWRALKEVAEFETPLAKSVAALAEERERMRIQRLKRNIVLGRVGLIVVAALGFGTTGFFSGQYLATERPWEDQTDWTQMSPPMIQLTVKKAAKVDDSALAMTAGDFAGEVILDEPKRAAPRNSGSSGAARKPKGSSSGKGGSKGGKSAKGPDKGTGGSGDKAPAETKVATAAATPEYNAAGLPRTLTQKQIMRVLAGKKGAIVGCLSSEAKSNPDMPPTVTIEFVITSAGTPADFKVRERQVRDGPLASCLKSKVMVLRWPKFFGENRTVTIPFNIKRR